MKRKRNSITGNHVRRTGRHILAVTLAATMALGSIPMVSFADQGIEPLPELNGKAASESQLEVPDGEKNPDLPERKAEVGSQQLADDLGGQAAQQAPKGEQPATPAALAAKPGLDTVKSIQAYTDETFYGTAVVKVEITYNDNVDLSGIDGDSYELLDRGSLTPDYGDVPIANVEVDDDEHKVTLIIAGGTTATKNNALDYTTQGTNGKRERNTFGAVVTGSWYRDTSGNIHYGKEADAEKGYQANTTGMGYQARESLELILKHTGDPEDACLHLADEKGQYTGEEKWAPTINLQFSEGGFRDLYDLKIPSTAADAGDKTADDYVRGYYYVPEDYDPADGIIFTLQGQGISYWRLPDGTDNAGCGFMFDSATYSWRNKGAIVVNIHDRSSAASKFGKWFNGYDFVVDDANVMKYFIDKYDVTGNIALQGNSRGTMASAILLKALAGQPYNAKNQNFGASYDETEKLDKSEYNFTVDSYICQNGSFGFGYDEEDWKAVADTGLRVWAFDGEQDSNNIESIGKYTELMTARKGEEWTKKNVRLTGYPSEIFSYWGESDHSVTRINGWYFHDEPFYGPDVTVDDDGNLKYESELKDGDKYTLQCRGKAKGSNKEGYEYTVYADSFQTWALTPDGSGEQVRDLDSFQKLDIDYSQAAQLPLTGKFTKKIDVNGDGKMDDGRSVEVYIADNASIRSYFTVIAVPDQVDTWTFLEEQGWLDLAEEKGEGLFILEPGRNGWGGAEEEQNYVKAALAFLRSGKNAGGNGVFSTFGIFYLAGYGSGSAPLELWAAENPLLVISQAYQGGRSAGAEALKEKAERVGYGAENTGGYKPIPDFEDTLKVTGMSPITAADVPVPTWLNSYSGSTEYWVSTNDCEKDAQDGIYHQKKDSEALQTAYANSQLPASEPYGIAEVRVTGENAVSAADIYAFLSRWTRYDNTYAYSNALALRLDFTKARVAAQEQAKQNESIAGYSAVDHRGNEQQVNLTGTGRTAIDGHGTVEVGVFSFSDNNGDGVNDPREYLVYIPDGYQGQKLPVLCVYPGNTQSDSIFFDCTQWYQIADSEGIALAFVCETYSDAVSITHKDADLYQTALMAVLRNRIDGDLAKLDFTRVYGTGQSLGSMTTQGFARTNPEFFAAVASTSGAMNRGYTDSGRPIPTYMIDGQSDLDMLLPDLAGAPNLPDWGNYFLKVNGLNRQIGTKEDNYGADTHELIGRRYRTYTWLSEDGIPLFKWGQTLMRSHNCYPGEMRLLWNYLKHFSMENGADGKENRYYSASAFTGNDQVKLFETKKPDAGDHGNQNENQNGNTNSDSGKGGSSNTGSGSGGSRNRGGSSNRSAGYGVWKLTDGSWYFTKGSAHMYPNGWGYIRNPYAAAGQPSSSWFHFAADGRMQTGWLKETDGRWYYLNPVSDNTMGAMLTGWQQIEGKWYYLRGWTGGPLGSLITDGATPDGYHVLPDGSWDGKPAA